ncbi:MAG: tripartite tricarboxylate transporter substrate binding protein [Betaproteobacteria bacterium]|nr:tripartite tricarboxylate transporter substrate binding protein [Betaproteobacteria bacterium]
MDRLSRVFALGICVAGLSVAPAALAQGYPTKPVRVVVPYPPGGVGDTTMRAIAQQLSESLGQPFVIDNKPGASQMIGADAVAKAAPDGYTLFLGSVTSLAINISSQKKMPYDPVKDFAPVSMLYFSPMYLVVNPAVPAQSVKELVALAKAQPGKLSFASIGQGGSIHLAGEMFKSMAGVDITHIPYKGSAPALTDIIGGQVSLMFDAGVSALPQVRAGKLRALAITTAKRVDSTPELPTVAEAGGLPNYEATLWFGLVAPAATPRDIVNRLSQELAKILRQPALQARFANLGVEFSASSPEEFATYIRAETLKWGKVFRDAKVEQE